MVEWFSQEIVEIAKLRDEIDSYTELALHLNASFENLRRQGYDYERMKEEIIATGRANMLKRKEFENWHCDRCQSQK